MSCTSRNILVFANVECQRARRLSTPSLSELVNCVEVSKSCGKRRRVIGFVHCLDDVIDDAIIAGMIIIAGMKLIACKDDT